MEKNRFIIIKRDSNTQKEMREILPIIGPVSFSTGDGLETSQRYGYDSSKKPQTLCYRRRNTALTATLQLAFTPTMCAERDVMMMDYIADLEQLCGNKSELYWNGVLQGSFVIQSVQFSGVCDNVQIFPQISVSIAMTEGYILRENRATEVKAL